MKDVYNLNTQSFLNKKKARTSSKGVKSKVDKEIQEEIIQTIGEPLIYEQEKLENEPTYCFCNGISYGSMIKCDYDNVHILYLNKV